MVAYQSSKFLVSHSSVSQVVLLSLPGVVATTKVPQHQYQGLCKLRIVELGIIFSFSRNSWTSINATSLDDSHEDSNLVLRQLPGHRLLALMYYFIT